jgi:hypothetical protein
LILLWRNDSQMVDLSVLKAFTDRTWLFPIFFFWF